MAAAAVPVSIVLPVYNEAALLERSVAALAEYASAAPLLDRFEIILVCNGCGDGSNEISRMLAARDPEHIRALCLTTRGLGLAIRAGIEAAAYEHVMFYAVDLPFGLHVIGDSAAALEGEPRRIVIGSKGHPQSAIERSLLFPREILRTYGAMMDSAGPFFQAQIVIYGRRLGCDVVEIPVILRREREVRATRFKLLGDGLRYIGAIIRERHKLAAAQERSDES